ncbi:MAG: type II secretion system major pseudopilin GspG [Pseudomonadota bacterium]
MTDTLRAAARRKTARRQRGFTLIELLVVLVILGLLATVVVINVLPAQDRALVTKAETDIATYEQALQSYRLDMLSYPTTEQGLSALSELPAGVARADRYRPGGYVRRIELDPWGNPYQYVYPGQRGDVDIFSYGADGRPGGEGLDADIGNWE